MNQRSRKRKERQIRGIGEKKGNNNNSNENHEKTIEMQFEMILFCDYLISIRLSLFSFHFTVSKVNYSA